MREQTLENLRGAVDTHIHTAPDAFAERKYSDLEIAAQAARHGLRAIVLKSHALPTADRALLARSLHPEVEVYGGIALNRWSGGLNPHAVEAALDLDARIVWLPTLHSVHELGLCGKGGGVDCVADGRVVPALEDILRLLAQSERCALATGHLAKEEQLIVVDRAKELGVARIIVNHPALHRIGMGIEEQRRLLEYGVFFERCYGGSRLPDSPAFECAVDESIEAIRALGHESTIIASDLGQPSTPDWFAGLSEYIARLEAAGFGPEAVRRMTSTNAARAIGLD